MENANEKRLRTLREKAAALPLRPGVYLMKDAGGRILYVGKSKALKNRVGSYFEQSADHGPKTKKMVSQVADFDFILCDTEIEALALENKQIKLHRPKYNIRLKDDKSYPYIRLGKGTPTEWATLTVTRSRKSDKAAYFGPYSGMSYAYGIVDTVRRVLGLPGCKAKFPADIGRVRPCLYAQIGQCAAPCAGKIDAAGYEELEKQAAALLRGNFRQVREELQKKMEEASEALRFEAAARYRDRIASLERLWDKQKVVGSPDTEYDAVAFYDGETDACLAVQQIRQGVLVDTDYLLFGGDEITDAEAIRAALYDLYLRREELPKEICFGREVPMDDPDGFAALLEGMGGRGKVTFPERGDKKAALTLLLDNAKLHAEEAARSRLRDNKTLLRLGQLLGMDTLPERIESVDISNLGDEQITAGLILFTDGKPDKRGYRTYKIRGTGGKQNDYASMREAISRRLDHIDTQPLPDLLLLDGGVGHVHTVQALLAERGVILPVFGMVKDEYHKTRTLTDGENEIGIAGEQAVFTLVYKIQEEVHRYTVGRMMQGKRKTLKKSVLTEIPGIGDGKAAALLKAFGGLGGLRRASESELAAVKGIGKKDAAAVYAALQKQNEKGTQV